MFYTKGTEELQTKKLNRLLFIFLESMTYSRVEAKID